MGEGPGPLARFHVHTTPQPAVWIQLIPHEIRCRDSHGYFSVNAYIGPCSVWKHARCALHRSCHAQCGLGLRRKLADGVLCLHVRSYRMGAELPPATKSMFVKIACCHACGCIGCNVRDGYQRVKSMRGIALAATFSPVLCVFGLFYA